MATKGVVGFLLLSSVVVVADVLDGDSCHVRKVTELATDKVPKGGLEADGIQVLARGQSRRTPLSAEYCISHCCQLGPNQCQYLWVIWGSCFAVSCQPESDSCVPVPLNMSSLYPSFSNVQSVYVPMAYPSKSPSTNPTPPARTLGSLQESTGGADVSLAGREDGVTETDSVLASGVSDTPPLAQAGGDVLVVLPQTNATLFGNTSTDDKGIVYYLWQLTAEDHLSSARILDPNSPVAHVTDLSPGTYTFALTVVDTNYQSDTDKVLVRVLAGPHEFLVDAASTEDLHESEGRNSSMASVELKVVYSQKRLLLKVLVPVLVMLFVILLLSAAVVLTFVCLCSTSKRKRHLYRYRQLTHAVEET